MKWWRRDMLGGFNRDLGHGGVFVISVLSLCQRAMTLKHVYDHDAFHAFLQRLGPKLCRTRMCMG